MSKRQLNHRQLYFIRQKQEKDRQKAASMGEVDFGQPEVGLILACFGKKVEIEDVNGHVRRCALRQHLGTVVPGDEVTWCPSESGEGVVTAVNPRRSMLGRPDKQGEIKPIAANVDQIVIVMAVVPDMQLFLLDSYLVAAQHLSLKPILIFNKIDLQNRAQLKETENLFAYYQGLGYTVVFTSCEKNQGLNTVSDHLIDQVSVFVGQSGVGKSSLVSALLPNESLKAGAISEGSGLGRHTTTTARLYHFAHGGDLIDSPGIRSFSLWPMSADELARGFVDFLPLLEKCQFRNCEHHKEPGCAVVEAVKSGHIPHSRLDSFLRLNSVI